MIGIMEPLRSLLLRLTQFAMGWCWSYQKLHDDDNDDDEHRPAIKVGQTEVKLEKYGLPIMVGAQKSYVWSECARLIFAA